MHTYISSKNALKREYYRWAIYEKLPKTKIKINLKTKKIFANYIRSSIYKYKKTNIKDIKYYEISKNDLSVRLNLLMFPVSMFHSGKSFHSRTILTKKKRIFIERYVAMRKIFLL